MYAQIDNQRLEVVCKPPPWQERGLSYTPSGYGAKIPTRWTVKHMNRWKRVYCRCYSNVGTLYIMHKGGRLTIDLNED